ncbi:hypothetical protein ACVGVM_27190 [Pseudonocardia bannensis]|uniref:Integral membrane protein n=1 Tax=Pseudonocardia bannensis TaxID=630973 RepID=A0A848DGX8_9PSEU|nr:hypothetical protein [Pseudonocardia bannensis]NMH91932.1 hypothetical protein [Pseudonocardia bannensis]
MLIGLIVAIVAMVLNSAAGLLQSDGAGRATRRRPLVLQPRYLVGLVVDALAWVCTVVALRYLPVFVVQAVLGGAIALTALATRWLYGAVLRPIDRVAIVACLLGLVLVAASAGDEEPKGIPPTVDLVLLAALVVLVGALLALRNTRHAWPLALVAGLGFGGTSLAVRAVQLRDGGGFDLVGLLAQPATYLLIGYFLVGLISYSRALGRGDISAVTAVFTVTEVVVPGLVAIALLGDPVRPGWVPALVSGLLLAVAGVVVLARSPAQHLHPERDFVR